MSVWHDLELVRRHLQALGAEPLPDPLDEADAEELIEVERRRVSLLREFVA